MVHWFYDLGFLIFSLLSLPHFLGRLKQAEEPRRLIKERFGFFSQNLLSKVNGKRSIWIHGVSVGEILAVEKLVERLLERAPGLHLILTTVTPTGQRIAKQWESDRVSVLYLPFDFSFSVRRFLEILKPSVLLLVETEIWPNLIELSKRYDIPIVIVNGRISMRSYRAFNRFRTIFSPLLRRIDLFLMQAQTDEERLTALGVAPERVKVTGNMKLDAFDSNRLRSDECDSLRRRYGFFPNDQILIGGSTHAGEEEILLWCLHHLRAEGFPLKLLLAPRHIERASKILKGAQGYGFQASLVSQLGRRDSSFGHPIEVLVLDRLGELRQLYGIGDVVFMGGSLVRHGGQNPIEPASFARPILHGRWVFNFEEIYHRLEEEGASMRVSGREELVFALKRMLTTEQERKQLGGRAYAVLEKLRGATERNLDCLEPWIKIGKQENEKVYRS